MKWNSFFGTEVPKKHDYLLVQFKIRQNRIPNNVGKKLTHKDNTESTKLYIVEIGSYIIHKLFFYYTVNQIVIHEPET